MGVVDEGINYSLNKIFPTGPNIWYVGLINNTPTPVLSVADTLAQVGGSNGWAEIPYTTGYSGNRRLWTNGAASGKQITNSSYVQFAMLNTYTVYGIFLATAASGTSGTLFGTAPLVGGTQGVVNTDTLQITITSIGASS